MAMIWVAVESSQMDEVGYDPEISEMQIKFSGKGSRPGSLYRYPGQSQENADVMQGADREARRNLFAAEIKWSNYEKIG